jgi:hypothetical protein
VCGFCGFRCNNSTNLTSHVRTIHKEATFTTGKAAKEAKRKNLLKEMLTEKSKGENGAFDEEEAASLLPVSLGLDVLKRLECQGKIVTRVVKTSPAPPRRTVRRPQPTAAVHEKSLIRRNRRSRDQIFTVTNSRGDLVEALVSLDATDESLLTLSG